MRRVFLALALAATPLAAQQQTASTIAPARSLTYFTPLGFLQFGPTVEYQAVVAPRTTIGGGFRLVSLGLLAHLLAAADDDKLGMAAWTLVAQPVFYFADNQVGHFVGPRLEWGKADTDFGQSTLLALTGEYGHRWRYQSGVTWSLGGQLGMITDDFKGDDPTDDNKETILFAALVITVGRAR